MIDDYSEVNGLMVEMQEHLPIRPANSSGRFAVRAWRPAPSVSLISIENA